MPSVGAVQVRGHYMRVLFIGLPQSSEVAAPADCTFAFYAGTIWSLLLHCWKYNMKPSEAVTLFRSE